MSASETGTAVFKGFTECEKMDFKARFQRVGSFEVLIQVKTPDEGFVIYKEQIKVPLPHYKMEPKEHEEDIEM